MQKSQEYEQEPELEHENLVDPPIFDFRLNNITDFDIRNTLFYSNLKTVVENVRSTQIYGVKNLIKFSYALMIVTVMFNLNLIEKFVNIVFKKIIDKSRTIDLFTKKMPMINMSLDTLITDISMKIIEKSENIYEFVKSQIKKSADIEDVNKVYIIFCTLRDCLIPVNLLQMKNVIAMHSSLLETFEGMTLIKTQ